MCELVDEPGSRLKAKLGKPGIVGPPESPRAFCNHLRVVVASREED